MTQRYAAAVFAPFLLLACNPPAQIVDATPDGSDGAAVDAHPDSGPVDAPNPLAPLSYMPAGCTYTVTTTTGTVNNRMGDDHTFGPSPMPLRVHVTWASDPSTTAAVLWATDFATIATVVQYGTSPGSLTQTAIGHVTEIAGALHEHEVHICGLTPDTTYYYQAGGPGRFGATQSFRTAPARGGATDVNFAVAGDSRDSSMIFGQVQQQILAVSGMRQPDFEVFTGDAIFLGTAQSGWNDWFDAAASTMALVPFVFVQGNHEALALNYFVQIAQPQVGMPQQDELYFSFDYGPIHFVVLNDSPYMNDLTGVVEGTELAWLRADLAAVDRTHTPWVIVSHHKSPFTTSTHAPDSDVMAVRATWPPVFAMNNVDLVIGGHDHMYQATQPLLGDGTAAGAGQHGVVYVTTSGAGAMLYPTGTNPVAQYAESTYNFVLVHATTTMLQVTPYRMDGTAITMGNVLLTRP